MPDIPMVTNYKVDMVWNGVRYECRIPGTWDSWAFPVGHEQQYPPEMWYAATVHDLTGAKNGGYRHSGIDLNLAYAEFGDVERRLGLAIYAIANGVVHYVTDDWSGVPMIVVIHEHNNLPLYTRYGHIIPAVLQNESVKAGQKLGSFANWKTGDHLHFDMSPDEFTREWITPNIRWVDPVPILKEHLDPARVEAMLER